MKLMCSAITRCSLGSAQAEFACLQHIKCFCNDTHVALCANGTGVAWGKATSRSPKCKPQLRRSFDVNAIPLQAHVGGRSARLKAIAARVDAGCRDAWLEGSSCYDPQTGIFRGSPQMDICAAHVVKAAERASTAARTAAGSVPADAPTACAAPAPARVCPPIEQSAQMEVSPVPNAAAPQAPDIRAEEVQPAGATKEREQAASAVGASRKRPLEQVSVLQGAEQELAALLNGDHDGAADSGRAQPPQHERTTCGSAKAARTAAHGDRDRAMRTSSLQNAQPPLTGSGKAATVSEQCALAPEAENSKQHAHSGKSPTQPVSGSAISMRGSQAAAAKSARAPGEVNSHPIAHHSQDRSTAAGTPARAPAAPAAPASVVAGTRAPSATAAGRTRPASSPGQGASKLQRTPLGGAARAASPAAPQSAPAPSRSGRPHRLSPVRVQEPPKVLKRFILVAPPKPPKAHQIAVVHDVTEDKDDDGDSDEF
jgi:hypothetical protein